MAHTMAVLHGGKRARRLSITDFLLTWGRKRQSSDQMLAALKTLAARQGGTNDAG